MTKQEGFTPIGQTAPTVTRANRPEAGSSAGQAGAVASPHDMQVAAWLAAQRPADMDAAAASRARRHGVVLRVKSEMRFPTGPNGERLPAYDVAVRCEICGDAGGVGAALADLRKFMTPAPARQIEAWLAELSVIVARRPDDPFADELRLVAYASRLAQYPADAVRTALLVDPHRFWPTWEELERRLAALTSPRRSMIAALERGPADREPPRRPPTEEERARVQEMVSAAFGSPCEAPGDGAECQPETGEQK